MPAKKAKTAPTDTPTLWWHVPEDEWYSSAIAHWSEHVASDTDDGVLVGYAFSVRAATSRRGGLAVKVIRKGQESSSASRPEGASVPSSTHSTRNLSVTMVI